MGSEKTFPQMCPVFCSPQWPSMGEAMGVPLGPAVAPEKAHPLFFSEEPCKRKTPKSDWATDQMDGCSLVSHLRMGFGGRFELKASHSLVNCQCQHHCSFALL